MEKNWLDHQHRGFSAYLAETAPQDACQKFSRAIISASNTSEKLDTVLLDCKVHTDWIQQIEEALPFIENAVQQNRQFILRQGETVPLEKAKRVSRASVEHLSRHSELITTIPAPGEELRPDKLYITENIGTYTIYENRFLYMLLCYLRDFAGLRYRKITELAASFSSDIAVSKQLTHKNRTIHFQLNYKEASQGTEDGDSQAAPEIRRIKTILQTVDLLLRTELMKEVALAPMLKPPIARTNVLLHDPNFKVAFELYTFLVEYTRDGYERLERHRHCGPLSDDVKEDFAALISVTSYLSYLCGGLRPELQERLDAENLRRKAEENRLQKQRLDELKEKLGQVSGPALGYITELETRVATLEEKDLQTEAETALRLETEAALAAATAQIGTLQTAALEAAAQLQEKSQEVQCLANQNSQLKELTQAQLQQAQDRLEEQRQQFEQELAQQKQAFLQEYEALAEKYRLAKALSRNIEDTDTPCCTKEAFAELEKEYEAFRRFYEHQWKLTKKQIRKEQLWKK